MEHHHGSKHEEGSSLMKSMENGFKEQIEKLSSDLEAKHAHAKELEGKVSTAEYELKIQGRNVAKFKVIADNLELESKQDKGTIKTIATELAEMKLRLESAESRPAIEINNLQSPLASPKMIETNELQKSPSHNAD